jgi:preprotein translocase subunit SecD
MLLAPAVGRAEAEVLTFAILAEEVAEFREAGEVFVIRLTPEAGKRFARFTAANICRDVQVIVAGVIVVTARVQAEISSGQIQFHPVDENTRALLRARLSGD